MLKYYLSVNPYGGGKKGLKILEKIKPLFSEADIELNIIETRYAGHVKDLIMEVNMDGYAGFCCIGGDGTMHEAINGYMKRPDKKKFPLGLITGGTGNAFMHDLNCLDPVVAAKRIIKADRRVIDIFSCDANGDRFYGFNIIGWGLPTDSNVLADKLRWIGEQRYNISSILEVLKHKKRFARVELDGSKIAADFAFILGCNTIHTGKGMQMAPLARLNDGLIDVIIVRKVARWKLLKIFPKIFSGGHIGDSAVDYRQVKNFKIIPEEDSKLNIDGEILGSTPIEVNVIPSAIKVLV